jgi:hypothetical protein
MASNDVASLSAIHDAGDSFPGDVLRSGCVGIYVVTGRGNSLFLEAPPSTSLLLLHNSSKNVA